MKKQLDTVSFFSGIGAFEKAAERLGINLKIKAYSEIDKWASTSYSAIHRISEIKNMGDILKIDPNEVPDCDLITHGSPCFKAGTLVKTINGFKRVESIEKGDMVLTHKNRFKEVVKPMINYTDDIYKLVIKGVETYVTEEHPYYVRKIVRYESNHPIYKRILSEPEWVTVKELTKDCYIGQYEYNECGDVNNVVWVPYTSKTFIKNFNEPVYNFEVKDDNSYVANNCIVHNCQDFSVAGQNKGGDKGSKTRSSLMWTTVNIIKHKRPKYVIWENVKGVLSEEHKHNFDNYLLELEKLGYVNYHSLLNAKNYGIPQNRDRIYVISIRNDIDKTFNFPKPLESNLRLKHLLENNVDEKYFIKKESYEKIIEEIKEKRLEFNRDYILSHNVHQVRACLTPDRINRRQEGRRFKNDGEPMFTVTANDRHGVIMCQKVMTIPNHIINDNERQRRVYSPEGISPAVLSRSDSAKIIQLGLLDMKGSEQIRRIYDPKGIAPTLDTMQGGHRQPKILLEGIHYASLYFRKGIILDDFTEPDIPISPTLKERINLVPIPYNSFKIRKLTPLECWRLMGFDDSDYWTAREALETKYYNGGDRSNSQMYKQAGNSIVVNVLEEIYKELFAEYI